MKNELIVAGKEMRDHLTSKRFIVIFAILLLLSVFGLVNGLNDYNKSLDQYKKDMASRQSDPYFQEYISSIQKRLAEAQSGGASSEDIEMIKMELEQALNPPMPSVMSVFYNINRYFAFIGLVLGVALGFDLITKEKEEGSLKSLLSHPVYRDSVLNGKAIGSIGMLAAAMGMIFLITIAIMLIFGVVPTVDDLLRIIAYFVVGLLFCSVFFSLALMMSTISKSSSMSMLYILGLIVALFLLSMVSYNIADLIMGAPPQPPDGVYPMPYLEETVKYQEINIEPVKEPVIGIPGQKPEMSEEWKKYIEDNQRYWERHGQIINIFNTISPMENFNMVSNAIISNYYPNLLMLSSSRLIPHYNSTVWDALASQWISILALIVEMVIALGISYVKFMRMDIR
jgi:ABC-2 type transport system permease protein